MRRDLDSIIRGCKKGNIKSQAHLYKDFAPTLYAICLRYCGHTPDAEDCLHDGFMKIFESINKYSGNGSFEGWLKRLMVNFCIDRHRRRIKMDLIDEMPMELADTLEEELPEDHTQLLELISDLPPKYRAVFNMYAIEDYSHKEIAKEFNIAESTSRSNYLRAKQIISRKVAELQQHGRSV